MIKTLYNILTKWLIPLTVVCFILFMVLLIGFGLSGYELPKYFNWLLTPLFIMPPLLVVVLFDGAIKEFREKLSELKELKKMEIKRKLREGLLIEAETMQADIPIPNNVLVLNNIFTDNGYELYLVGGAVRDFLMGNTIKDYDLATNARPDTIESMLQQNNIKTIGTGQKFGIINAFLEGEEYEIATFREDSDSGDGRRPDSVTFSDIKTDVNRRDLTINALFFNIETNQIVDYVGGIEDIKNGVVRTVGEPEKRFEEDKLRILRAIRFAHRTGNGLDPKIDRFLRSGYDLNEISYERIRDEFLKSIRSAKSVKNLMNTYKEYGMFKWIFPGMVLNDRFTDTTDYILVLTNLLIKNDNSTLSKKLNMLTYTVNEIRDIQFLKGLTKLSPETAPILKKVEKNTSVSSAQIMEFASLNNIPKNLVDTFNKYELSVNGRDVMEKYNLKGPELGMKIEMMEIENFKKLL